VTSYDQIPYRSLAFPQTHPDRLATVARIFALSPPEVATCRVLELGCASGGNLVPMAFNLPGAEFIGIDASRHQVDEAQAAIRELSLSNLRIEHASILDVDATWGLFDFIICHGVFSWVDTKVQDRIFEIAARNLAPNGVAYISYNTYPGWHVRDMVRHMMRYHAAQFTEPDEQVAQARALLTFLVSASEEAGPYNQLLRNEAERLGRSPSSYIFHEHLERTNLPTYFHQFMERAERVGLQYLAEAVVSEMLTSHFPASVAETIERISPDLLHLEQYMDFVRNRQFRQTLLCRDELRPRRSLSPDVLPGLLMSSPASTDTTSSDLEPAVSLTFAADTSRATVASPATKAALMMLIERWPCALEVNALCDGALSRAGRYTSGRPVDEVRRAMMDDLLGAVMHGLIKLHTQPPPCTNRPSEMPRAHPVAAFQATRGDIVVNAHHGMCRLDALALEVLKLASGRCTRHEMVDALLERLGTGGLSLDDGDPPITDPQVARALLPGRVEDAIASLTRNALLVA
jgi:methyltransferase-like protein/trans-aconitate methyltransferase